VIFEERLEGQKTSHTDIWGRMFQAGVTNGKSWNRKYAWHV
jgi:hypothetical protein